MWTITLSVLVVSVASQMGVLSSLAHQEGWFACQVAECPAPAGGWERKYTRVSGSSTSYSGLLLSLQSCAPSTPALGVPHPPGQGPLAGRGVWWAVVSGVTCPLVTAFDWKLPDHRSSASGLPLALLTWNQAWCGLPYM